MRHFYLFSGDIILNIEGKEVKGVRDVLDAIGLEIGRSIQLKVLRPGKGEFIIYVISAAEN